MKNGAPVIPIITVGTDYDGRIVSELVDALISQGSSFVDMVALVHVVLERKFLSARKWFQITEQQLLTGCLGRAHVQPL